MKGQSTFVSTTLNRDLESHRTVRNKSRKERGFSMLTRSRSLRIK